VRYLFWKLVPPHAIADVGPQPPLDALGYRLRELEQLGRLRERVEGRRLRDEPGVLRDQRRQLLQVPCAGPPPAPVRAEHLTEPVGVDHVAAVRPVRPGGLRRADRHPGEQVCDVMRVLGVQLEDLQLGQQQIGRVEGERRIAE
jgi:hypothetical protein